MDARLPPEAELRRRAAASLLHGLLALLLLRAALAPALGPPRVTGLPPPLAVDLAVDPAWRLRLLAGVGPTRSHALVEDRRRHGAPRTRADLLRVPGFGPGQLQALAASVEVQVLLAGRPLSAPTEAPPSSDPPQPAQARR